MRELDLIPPDYRDWIHRRGVLRRYVSILAGINVAILAVAALLGGAIERAQAEAARLKSENAITEQQELQLQQLRVERGEFEQQWSLLRGLRAGAAIDDIFSIIDRALVPGDLWFVDWSFRRAGVVVDGQTRGIETGYFIIVADDAATNEADLSVETHMTINGQAKDHEALSEFVRGLFLEPDIKDVNVRKTALSDNTGGRVVDFEMTLVLNSAFLDT